MLRDVLCCWSEWISWRFVGAVSASFFLIPNKEKTNLKPAKQKKNRTNVSFPSRKNLVSAGHEETCGCGSGRFSAPKGKIQTHTRDKRNKTLTFFYFSSRIPDGDSNNENGTVRRGRQWRRRWRWRRQKRPSRPGTATLSRYIVGRNGMSRQCNCVFPRLRSVFPDCTANPMRSYCNLTQITDEMRPA